MSDPVFTVSQLTSLIKEQLESRFPLVSVQGEISNFKAQASGHLYFTLKDAQAQISSVLFRGNALKLTRMPKDGDQIIAKGELSVYPPRGGYQIIIREIAFLGVGELLLQFQARKEKLARLGWFDASRKKKLPMVPKTIGVVTSPTGAVIQDILHVLTRRFSRFHLILYPVKVQGEGAAEEIARAITFFHQHRFADVLIVGRGGGSLEDLWAFNEECVADAIVHSEIPVISAVGHETDVTICDFVADVRAPTPSAAAEIATAALTEQFQFLHRAKERIDSHAHTSLLHAKRQLEYVKRHPFICSSTRLLEPHLQRLSDFASDSTSMISTYLLHKKHRLTSAQKELRALNPKAKISEQRQKLTSIARTLERSLRRTWQERSLRFIERKWPQKLTETMRFILLQKARQLKEIKERLSSIHPKHLLAKGYCILFRENSASIILKKQELSPQDKVQLMFSDGQAKLTVDEVLEEIHGTRNI